MEFVQTPFHDEDSEVHKIEMLTVLAAARRVGVTQSAILRWIRNGYLSATPSSNGWQIPAHMLEDARRASDDGRGAGPAPRRAHPTLEPTPTPIRHSMETRSVEIAEAAPAGIEAIGESVVAPLAELIRDQIDVVHDQAEVIGWLQAERARLNQEVADLKAMERQVDISPADIENVPEEKAHEEHDALVSLLWKHTAQSDEIDGLRVVAREEPAVPVGEPDTAEAAYSKPDIEPSFFDDWFVEDVTPQTPAPAEERPALRLEDYADPSWFFVPNDMVSFGDPTQPSRPVAVLKPIVPRSNSVSKPPVESEEDAHLRRMIDETERKIARLWQEEEQLRMSHPGVESTARSDVATESERESIWQRLWPARR